jgi:two-component system cell cycle response regulator DivK
MASCDQQPATPGSELRGTVLYIEDHPVSMEFVEQVLGDYPGVTLLKAATGREGIERVLADRPDLVLLDMHLPDIGGLEVVRALNEQLVTGRPRLILLTADSLSMDIIKAMSLGAHDYWIKPVEPAKLEAALRHALRRKS